MRILSREGSIFYFYFIFIFWLSFLKWSLALRSVSTSSKGTAGLLVVQLGDGARGLEGWPARDTL